MGLVSSFPISRWFTNSKLDTKLAIILTMAGMSALVILFLALSAIINPSFSRLESQNAANHIERTRAAFVEYSTRIETTVKDYAVWDESYSYFEQPTALFEQETSSTLAMTNLDVNAMAYVRFDGTLLLSKWVDIDQQSVVPDLSASFTKAVKALVREPKIKTAESIRYYARIGNRIAAISAARVLRTDGSGTPQGFVVMAREINSKQLTDLLQLDARLSLADRKPAALITPTSDALLIAVDILGLRRERVAQAKFSVDRSVTELGYSTLLLAVVSCACVLMLVLVAMRSLIKRIIITPMRNVEKHMQQLSISGQLRPLDRTYANDEIGSLVQNLNSMLSQQKNLREQLEIQSFELGRTESAVGVMHNVRNGLNPINVIISRALSTPQTLPEADLYRALEELSSQDIDSDRRAKLTRFLRLTVSNQVSQGTKRNAEMETARTCLQNVVKIIGDQQASAHQHIDTEACFLAAIIQQNAALAQFSVTGQVRFIVADSNPVADANRVLLSQVLGNLFANAVEAIVSAKRASGLIEVSFSEHDQNVLIHIRDNGQGFETNMSKTLFERGYSTRRQKSGGLGLHWCSNALAMMGGRLSLESDGPGLGATATLTLPKYQPRIDLDHGLPSEGTAALIPVCDSFAEGPPPKIQNRQ